MKEFEKNSFILFIFTMLTNIVNYLFQIITGRMLSIDSFGILNSLLSLHSILSIPALVIMMVVSKYVSENNALGKTNNILLNIFLNYTLIFAFFFIIVGIGLSGIIGSYINIEDKYLIILTILSVGVCFIFPVVTGGLQGEKKFLILGIVNLLFPLIKLFSSIIFILAGFELYGIILSFILGNIFAFFIGFCFLKFSIKFSNIRKVKIGISALKFVWVAFFLNIGLTVLTNVDILLVKHYFTVEETGYYSVASILGKMIMYISSALVLVMFPLTIESVVKKNETSFFFRKALLYGGGLSILSAIGLNILAKPVVIIMFGDKYLNSILYILPVSIWIFAISIVMILINYSLAINRASFLSVSLLIGCLILPILIYFIHESIFQIIFTLSAITYSILGLNVIEFGLKRKKRTVYEPAK